MAHPFDVIEVKMERANEHIRTLRRALRTFLSGDRYVINMRDDDGSPEAEAFVQEHTNKPVPLEVRVYAGEALHQIRSSLDHALCLLVEQNRKFVGRRHAFPIHEEWEDEDVRRFDNEVRGIHPNAIAFLKVLQPHPQPEPHHHPLSILKTMNDMDKHKSPVLAVAHVHAVEHPKFIDVPPGRNSGFVDINDVEKKLIADVVFPTFGRQKNVSVEEGIGHLQDVVRFSVLLPLRGTFFPE
jgi:hypothetical protein